MKLTETKSKIQIALDDRSTLEELLYLLSAVGQPRVSLLNTGWHASVDMSVKLEGGEFNIRSDFGHVDAGNAVRQCAERVIKAVTQFV